MNKLKEIIVEHVGFFIISFLMLMIICLIVASPRYNW